MNRLLLSGVVTLLAGVASANPTHDFRLNVLEGSKYSGFTGALDMVGSGVTFPDIMEDEIVGNYVQIKNIQKSTRQDFKKSLKDPMIRAAIGKLAEQKPDKTTLSAIVILSEMTDNDVISARFENYGPLSGLAEQAFGLAYIQNGWLQSVPNGAIDQRKALRKLILQMSSPADIQRSFGMRFGMGMPD